MIHLRSNEERGLAAFDVDEINDQWFLRFSGGESIATTKQNVDCRHGT